MTYKKIRKKKKTQKLKKYSVSLSRDQHELLKQHCSYTQNTPPQALKQAISIYLRQVSHDLNQWRKITPGMQFICEEDKVKQMEINF